jgi:hypothetical protein
MENEMTSLLELPDNLSYAAIAERMSAKYEMEISKNACIGKARRMGIPQRNGKPHKPTGRPRRDRMVRIKVDAPIAPKIRRNNGPGVTLQQLDQSRECHWPLATVEDKPPYVYCGKAAVDGTSWCHEHAARAYSKVRA